MSSDVFQLKLSQIWLKLHLVQLSINVLMHFVYFPYQTDKTLIANYVLAALASAYLFNVQLMLIVKSKVVDQVPQDLVLWNVATAGTVARRVKKIKVWAALNVIAALLTALSIGILDKSTKQYLLILELAELYLPKWMSLLVTYGLRIQLIPSLYTMTVHSLQLIYLTQHVDIQVEMLNTRFRNIVESEDEVYNVRDVMVFCFERYMHIAKFVEARAMYMGYALLTFSITGILIGIGVVYFLTQGTAQATYVQYFQVTFAILLFLIVFAGLIYSGQLIENQYENVYNALLSNNWYEWSASDRRNLLILLPKIMKPLKITYLELFQINYDNGFKIIRAIYSVTSVMVRMEKRHLKQ